MKHIITGFNHSPQITSESAVGLSDGLLVKICKFYPYSYLQFIFGVTRGFIGIVLMIIKGIVIWGVRGLDVWGDVVAEILLLRLVSPPWMEWCRVRWADVTLPSQVSSAYSKRFMLTFELSIKPCGEINRGVTSLSLVTNPNTMMWTRCYFAINMYMTLSIDWPPKHS